MLFYKTIQVDFKTQQYPSSKDIIREESTKCTMIRDRSQIMLAVKGGLVNADKR